MYEDFASRLAETMWPEFAERPAREGPVAEITDVSTTVVDGNFPWLLVTVETDAGVTGIGEAYPSPGVRQVITDFLLPVLVGQPPTDVNRLYHLMHESLSARGSQHGIATMAISGVEIALWDATGKLIDQPVYQLLGGKVRDSVRVYADCHAGEGMVTAAKADADEQYRPEACARAARSAVDDGFDILKFDIDIPAGRKRNPAARRLDKWEIEHKRRVVEAVTGEVGDEAEVGVDLHWNFTVESAAQLCQVLEPYDLTWVEDPIPPENAGVMAELNRATDVPLLTGENHTGRHGFRELLEAEAVSYLAPDVPKVGGIAETKTIAELASTYYRPIVPHNVGSPVATLATAHVGAVVPNFVAVEFHAREVPWWEDLVADESSLIRDGRLQVPDDPGLGIDLDWRVVEAHEKTD